MKYVHNPTIIEAFHYKPNCQFPDWLDRLEYEGMVKVHSKCVIHGCFQSPIEIRIENKIQGQENLFAFYGDWIIKDHLENISILNDVKFNRNYTILKNGKTESNIKFNFLDWMGRWKASRRISKQIGLRV